MKYLDGGQDWFVALFMCALVFACGFMVGEVSVTKILVPQIEGMKAQHEAGCESQYGAVE